MALSLHTAAVAAVVSRSLSGDGPQSAVEARQGSSAGRAGKGDPSGGTVPYGATLAGGEGHGRPPSSGQCARLDTT